MSAKPQTKNGAEAPLIFVVGARGVPDVEGGAEKNAEMLFPLVAASGNYRVTLVGLADNIKSDTFKGVRLLKAPRSNIMKTDKILYYVAAIFMALRLRPRIVHFQGLGSALFLWAYKLMGAKTVVRYGSADYLVGKWGLLGKLGFLLAEFQLRFADAVIAVTPALAERLARRGIKSNVHVIANAADPLPPVEPSAQQPAGEYILTVGRVTAQKNVANLIRGYEIFAKGVANAPKLVVAGGLDEADYVESLQPLLTERTVLAGKFTRSAMAPLYRGSKIYINASLHEGSSNAVLEAIGAGCSILLSDIPENRDFGMPPQNYFDPNSPDSIAGALKRALADPQAYVADAGKYLTWTKVAERTLDIYRGIAPFHSSETGRASTLVSAS
ncbi:MAG: glycosyltransferase family 4 protein [Hyphomonadaceae bacterium]|nr:glycosyltransferase family 4 protein [Hyphomonadaceae bacterium]